MSSALLVIDVQNDFISGSLAVQGGMEIVSVINNLMLNGGYDYIIASQDWHPVNHGSFASHHGMVSFSVGLLGGIEQVMWPDHCVQGSWGAEFHFELETDKFNYVQQKGMNTEIDSYSAFQDNGKNSKTGLGQWMTDRKIDRVDIAGIATEYCIKFTALDAVQMLLGNEVRVIVDACRGVNIDTSIIALDEMKLAGVQIISSTDALAELIVKN